jgi:uncharacterized protein (TIGR02284 family)
MQAAIAAHDFRAQPFHHPTEKFMENSRVVEVLNDLIETCKDGQYGFATCAERVKSASIKQVFTQRAQDCATAAVELQGLVQQYGGKAEQGGSAAGAVHRGWVKVVDAVTGSDDKAILDECERGEDAALARYRAALKEDGLPAAVQAVISRQQQGAQRNHDQVKALRDGYSATHG